MPRKSIDEILRQMQINKETELQKKEREEFLLFQKNEKLRQEYLRYIRTYEKIGVPSLAPSSSSSSAGGKIIISATASPTQSVPTIVTDNLQLYLDAGDTDSYPGSGTTWFDLSANAYTTATLVNGVGFTSSNGGALTFAVDDYVDVNQSLASGTFSVGCWFKTSSAGIKMLLSKETAAGNPWNYRIWMNDGQIYADMSQVTTQSNLTSPLTSYNDGNWYYVMFTRDDSNWYLYVNGQEVNTKLDTYVGSVTNAQELWIGRSAYLGGSYQFTGSIAQVFIYHKVLSASEILQNFDATKSRYGY